MSDNVGHISLSLINATEISVSRSQCLFYSGSVKIIKIMKNLHKQKLYEKTFVRCIIQIMHFFFHIYSYEFIKTYRNAFPVYIFITKILST